ncbi:hypothetical protein PR003_g34296, partial [Phytophthora rubi]
MTSSSSSSSIGIAGVEA